MMFRFVLLTLTCFAPRSLAAPVVTTKVTSTVKPSKASTSTTTKAPVIRVDVQGTSGKFVVYNAALGKSKGVQVNIEALREVDANGKTVGASVTPRHSIKTFASQTYTIGPLEPTSIVSNNRVVNASKISFSSTINTVGQVTIDTYVIKNPGLVGTANHSWFLQPGDLKWNIMLSSWQWCGCKKDNKTEIGAYIDVDINIKGFQQARRYRGSNKIVNLGNITQIQVSDSIIVDNSYQAAPSGYPLVLAEGKVFSVTFRFPRFKYFGMYESVVLSP